MVKAVQDKKEGGRNSKGGAVMFEIISTVEAPRMSAAEYAHSCEAQAREVFSEDRAIDVSDIATQTEAKLVYGKVAEISKRLKPQTHPDFDGIHCLDCGSALISARLKDGRIYCTPCQEAIEKQGALTGLRPWEC